MNVCYKVVKKIFYPELNDHRLFSALAGGESLVEYKIGVESKPPAFLSQRGYYIFAFKEVSFAAVFRDKLCSHYPEDKLSVWHYHTILECTYSEIVDNPEVPLDLGHLSNGIMRDCGGHMYNSPYATKVYDPWPEGTIMVKSLTPVKEST